MRKPNKRIGQLLYHNRSKKPQQDIYPLLGSSNREVIFLNSVKKKSQKSTISGIVIPDQWDTNGKVLAVTIHANDEKVFLVEHTKIGNDLLNFIHKEVEVTGKIRERLDGRASVGIKSYIMANKSGLDLKD